MIVSVLLLLLLAEYPLDYTNKGATRPKPAPVPQPPPIVVATTAPPPAEPETNHDDSHRPPEYDTNPQGDATWPGDRRKPQGQGQGRFQYADDNRDESTGGRGSHQSLHAPPDDRNRHDYQQPINKQDGAQSQIGRNWEGESLHRKRPDIYDRTQDNYKNPVAAPQVPQDTDFIQHPRQGQTDFHHNDLGYQTKPRYDVYDHALTSYGHRAPYTRPSGYRDYYDTRTQDGGYGGARDGISRDGLSRDGISRDDGYDYRGYPPYNLGIFSVCNTT